MTGYNDYKGAEIIERHFRYMPVIATDATSPTTYSGWQSNKGGTTCDFSLRSAVLSTHDVYVSNTPLVSTNTIINQEPYKAALQGLDSNKIYCFQPYIRYKADSTS